MGQVFSHGREVKPLFSREIRNAKATTQIQKIHRPGRKLSQTQRQLERLFLCLTNRLCTQILGARKQVKSFKRKTSPANLLQEPGHLLRIHTKLLGTTAHLHT